MTFHLGRCQRHPPWCSEPKRQTRRLFDACIHPWSRVEATSSHGHPYRRPHVSTFHQWYGEWWLHRCHLATGAATLLPESWRGRTHRTKTASARSRVGGGDSTSQRCPQLPRQQQMWCKLAQIVMQACLILNEQAGSSRVRCPVSMLGAGYRFTRDSPPTPRKLDISGAACGSARPRRWE